MKNLNIPSINEPSDVLAFFLYLHDEIKLNFHVDTPFDDYVEYGTESSKRSFTQKQAEELDATMEKCWTMCENYGRDIYEIALSVGGFETFFQTHRVITDRKAMQEFADAYDCIDAIPDELKAYHVFGSSATYFVKEGNGGFYMEIENGFYEGTLRELAIVLYNWLDTDVKDEYVQQAAMAE